MHDLSDIKDYIRRTNAQSHLCICNTDLFEGSLEEGVYGFPHSGVSKKKSFWRAVSSMYNIGNDDLIFLYRTNGDVHGCKEIHGPFKVYCVTGHPAIYYDLNSTDFTMYVGNEADCKVRFLFESMLNDVYSISDNYELEAVFSKVSL